MEKRFLTLASFLLIIFGIGVLFSSSIPTNKVNRADKDLVSEGGVAGETYSPTFNHETFDTGPPSQIIDEERLVLVVKVIDGDTLEVEGGKRIGYIGIDTPETVDPRKPVECFGRQASNKNRKLVEGKRVRLEKDISKKDKYGRLLRYIWVGDTLVNEVLVKEGYAYASSYPPDVKYQDRLNVAQKFAREGNIGLWGVCDVAGLKTNRSQIAINECQIKGNISRSGEKIYHIPRQRYYYKTVIDESKGERWFCSEKEAIDAGWRKSKI